MKEECIKFAKYLFEKREIELDFDVEDMYSQYEPKKKNYGLIYMNWAVANHFDVDAEWIKFPGHEGKRVLWRRLTQHAMSQYGHRNVAIADFYNVSRSNITQGATYLRNDVSTNKAVKETLKEVMELFA